MIEYGTVDIGLMCMNWINLFILVIVVENITEVLVKSEIFKPVRGLFFNYRRYKICNFVHDLLDCGYCTSFWVSLLFCIVNLNNLFYNDYNFFDSVLMVLIVHRLSNVFHYLVDLLRTFSHRQDL